MWIEILTLAGGTFAGAFAGVAIGKIWDRINERQLARGACKVFIREGERCKAAAERLHARADVVLRAASGDQMQTDVFDQCLAIFVSTRTRSADQITAMSKFISLVRSLNRQVEYGGTLLVASRPVDWGASVDGLRANIRIAFDDGPDSPFLAALRAARGD